MNNTIIKKRWVIAEPISAQADIELAEYSSMLRQLLYNRNIRNAKDARSYLENEGPLFDPFLLTDIDKAIDRIWQAVDQHETIIVYGDYDVDGVTATALLVQILSILGANVQMYIPNRFDEGYGVNNEAIDYLASIATQLIITVDCGIRSPREVEYARALGIAMIISDHHEPKGDLPQALAVINHKRKGDLYPDKNLAGVGIAYKICQALLSRRTVNIQLENWLDLVAVGTVSDVVPLTGENRALVKQGLKLLRLGQRQGLFSLARVAGLNYSKITTRDIGFVIGPRLNAAGRLETARSAYELLMAKTEIEAGKPAQDLCDYNRKRQQETANILKQAEELSEEFADQYLIFAVHPDFNRESVGLVGLVASRLAENFYRPAIVGCQVDEFTKASCRSIPEFHITKALDQCSHLLERHGGHAMAAGFTVKNENLPELKRCLLEIAEKELSQRDLTPVFTVDKEISLSDLHDINFDDLDALEPTGMSNPEVLFMSHNLSFKPKSAKAIGAENKHLRFTVFEKGGALYDAIAFRQGYWIDNMPQRVDLIYKYEKNEYMGNEKLQLNVLDIRPSEL